MSKKWKKAIERYAPSITFALSTTGSAFLEYIMKWYITGELFTIWLNISLALAAIYLSFVGVAIGVVLAIVNTVLIKNIYKYHAEKDLIDYIKSSAFTSVWLFLLSVVFLLVYSKENEVIPSISFAIWFGIFLGAFCASGRIVYYLFLIMKAFPLRTNSRFEKK